MLLPLTSRIFGTLPDGKAVEAWTLCGSGGLRLEIITYGAAVTRLLVPDRDGRLADVVLGFNNLAPYATGRTYSGAVIGRVAGRMTGARFSLEGITYELTRNDGLNHLHGAAKVSTRRSGQLSPCRMLLERHLCDSRIAAQTARRAIQETWMLR